MRWCYLFFIGVGISLAILIITRKEIREESKTAKEDEEDDDFWIGFFCDQTANK